MLKKVIPGLPFNSNIVELGIKENLSTSEVLLLLILRMRMRDKNLTCWPSQKTLAEEARVSEKWIRVMIKKLENKNIIKVRKRQKKSRYGNNSHEYQFVFPWKICVSTSLDPPKQEAKPEPSSVSKADKPELSSPVKPELSSIQTGTQFPLKPELSSHSDRNSVPPNKQSEQTKKNKPSSINKTLDDDPSLDLSETKTMTNGVAHECKKEITCELVDNNNDECEDTKKQLESGNNTVEETNESAIENEEPWRPLSPPPRPKELPTLKKGDLKKFYGKNPPKKVDLTKADGYVNLWNYIKVFKDGDILLECYGTKFEEPMPSWWKEQAEEYYELVIKNCWSANHKPPGIGFKVTFFRALRAGVMERCGFRPLSPEELEYENWKKEQERKRQEALKRIEEREKKQLAAIKNEKLEKIRKVLDDLDTEDLYTVMQNWDLAQIPGCNKPASLEEYVFWEYDQGHEIIPGVKINNLLKNVPVK
jgi:hypothetical protein